MSHATVRECTELYGSVRVYGTEQYCTAGTRTVGAANQAYPYSQMLLKRKVKVPYCTALYGPIYKSMPVQSYSPLSTNTEHSFQDAYELRALVAALEARVAGQ